MGNPTRRACCWFWRAVIGHAFNLLRNGSNDEGLLRRWQEEGHVCRGGDTRWRHAYSAVGILKVWAQVFIFIYRRDPDAYANFQAAHSQISEMIPYSYDSRSLQAQWSDQASSSLRRALRVRTGKQMGSSYFRPACP